MKATIPFNHALRQLISVVILLCGTVKFASAATFTNLLSFGQGNGSQPSWHTSLVQALDGNLYGTTRAGGSYGCGTVFRLTPTGALTTIRTFKGTNGCHPNGVTLGADFNLYGTTSWGGTANAGTIFRITLDGTLTTLINFAPAFGANPASGLIKGRGTDRALYGSTRYGGTNDGGTIFTISAEGVVSFSVLHNFGADANPIGGLVQGSDTKLYGTTSSGGAHHFGSVFSMTPMTGGAFAILYSFGSNPSDGKNPVAALVQGTDGNFYGSTKNGGTAGSGTVFKITASGTLTTLSSMVSAPTAPLVQATDGNFYGTDTKGGTFGTGSVFQITPAGVLTTLFSFDGSNGSSPQGLTQDTDGMLYGTTTYGGIKSFGTAFAIDAGLAPFVQALPNEGQVGACIDILGSDLTGASGVSFNGTPATVGAVSDSQMLTQVPSGATSGPISVDTVLGPVSTIEDFTVLNGCRGPGAVCYRCAPCCSGLKCTLTSPFGRPTCQ